MNLKDERSDFIKAFEETCSERSYRENEKTQELCVRIQMYIDETLSQESDYGSDESY